MLRTPGVSVFLCIVFFLTAIWLPGCVPLSQQGAGSTSDSGNAEYYADVQLRYEDFVYDSNVKSVQLYPATGHPEEVLNPAIIPVTQEQPLLLEFDQINSPQQRFVVKLIYCNADWTEARITQIQYLQDFNEFFITDITPSYNTKVPYFHYRFRVPPVKLSGNYLLLVTNQNGRNILSQRMLVYEQRVNVGAKPVLTTGGSSRFTNQQVDFNIYYNSYPLLNPSQELKVVLRQNYRWDNAKQNLRPLYIRDTEKRLEYSFFDLQHTFPGGNEYRYFDNRSNRTAGANIASINREVVPAEVFLARDITRAREAFSQQIDINGQYITGNREFGNPAVSADYNWITFNLETAGPATGNVYVFGELSNWKMSPDFKLEYNATEQRYTGRALLKQGYYNYAYALQPTGTAGADETYYEGSFNTTENTYDILVYYRPPGTRTDLLIGYQKVNYNGRR